ncbi:MAG: hypothetical protein K2Q18_05680 [Bdellovibrionales bacterium]|nr:hypothetical protein [Bdellovibrionales bacterium]
MNKKESFENLLKRFFSNVDESGKSQLSSSLIYDNVQVKEVRVLFLEMIKILGVKLYTPLFFEEELKDLRSQIAKIKSKSEIDDVVEVIEDLLPHCQHFMPSYFSTRDLVPGKITSEIKNFFKVS